MAMPRWKHTLDIKVVWNDEGMDLPEKGKAIVEKIKAAPFWEEGGELEELVDELADAAEADDEHWFNLVWNEFYDWADAERVWVKTAF